NLGIDPAKVLSVSGLFIGGGANAAIGQWPSLARRSDRLALDRPWCDRAAPAPRTRTGSALRLLRAHAPAAIVFPVPHRCDSARAASNPPSSARCVWPARLRPSRATRPPA